MGKDSQIQALYTSNDIAVSDFRNPEWTHADVVRIDRYWSGESALKSRHAEARLLWSRKALHVRFVCHQAEPLVVSDKPQTEKKTMGLWDRDVCEIFIAPDPHVVERYLEFEVAPTGEWLDVAIDLTSGTRQSDWEFNSHMTTAAKTAKDQVIMAMRIPWNHWIHQPQQGERWRVNLFRCVGKDPNRGYLSWQPTRTPEPLFHVPKAFGWLIFR
jgi:cellulose/xylan binding protein with CBM9 domain